MHAFRLVAAVILSLPAVPASAQAITETQAEEILRELRQIRQLLEGMSRPPAPAAPAPPAEERVPLPAVSGPALGRADAPLTLVEFTDLECPYCRQFHATTFPEIQRDYVDTGKLRFVSLDFPLGFHPNAKRAAVATRCAGEQGRYWELRHALARKGDTLSPGAIVGHAAGLGLDMEAFQACLDSGRFEAALQKDLEAAAAAGVSGTPTFVIGRTGSPEPGFKITGALPYAAFRERIERLLGQAAAPPRR